MQFENFEPEENSRIMTVRESFQHSVNLVFVRLMRDIVRYYEFKTPSANIQQLADAYRVAQSLDDANKDDDDDEPGDAAPPRRAIALCRQGRQRGIPQALLQEIHGKSIEESRTTAGRFGACAAQAPGRDLPQSGIHKPTWRISPFMRAEFPEAELKRATRCSTLYDKFGID